MEKITAQDSFYIWRTKLNKIISNLDQISAFPDINDATGKILTTNGSLASWGPVNSYNSLPNSIPVSDISKKISSDYIPLCLTPEPNTIPRFDNAGKIPTILLKASETKQAKTIPVSDSSGKIDSNFFPGTTSTKADSVLFLDASRKISNNFFPVAAKPEPKSLLISDNQGKIDQRFISNPPAVMSISLSGSFDSPIGYTTEFTLYANSHLFGQSITKVRKSFNKETFTEQPYTSGMKISVQIPAGTEPGTIFSLEIFVSDSVGNEIYKKYSLNAVQAYVNTPQIMTPQVNAILPIPFSMSCTPFLTTGMTDTLSKTHWRISSDFYAKNILHSKETTGTDVNISMNVSGGAFLYLSCAQTGNTLPKSPYSEPIIVRIASIIKPTISSPINGVNVINSVTIVSSLFNSEKEDEHISSDFRITKDSEGKDVVAEVLNSTNKLSYTFSNLSVESGTRLYAWVRHNGKKYGSSPWSNDITYFIYNRG